MDFGELLRANEIVNEQCIVEANNLGAFYRFVNTCISNRSTVGAIVDEGLILTDNRNKANAFSKYFSSVGVADNGSIPHCRDMQLTDVLECVTFNEVDIANSIDRLKCNLSAGPGGLPQFYLRSSSIVLVDHLLCYLISLFQLDMCHRNG